MGLKWFPAGLVLDDGAVGLLCVDDEDDEGYGGYPDADKGGNEEAPCHVN